MSCQFPEGSVHQKERVEGAAAFWSLSPLGQHGLRPQVRGNVLRAGARAASEDPCLSSLLCQQLRDLGNPLSCSSVKKGVVCSLSPFSTKSLGLYRGFEAQRNITTALQRLWEPSHVLSTYCASAKPCASNPSCPSHTQPCQGSGRWEHSGQRR